MIAIMNEETGEVLGEVSQDVFKFLTDMLEEESSEDADYFIAPGTIDMLEARGAAAELVALLRQAVGESEGIEITWQPA
jgi:hypothetical protein